MFIHFSDSAKFAVIARYLLESKTFASSFAFWDKSIFQLLSSKLFAVPWVSPVMPLSIAVFFKLLGINDFAVIATSFFFFLLTLIFVFLLAKKVYRNNLVGILSTIAVGFNYDLINYATNGASESPIIFEIVAATYCVSLKKKWGNGMALFMLILMYFTRPQAFIYISGIALYYLLLNFKTKKAVLYFGLASLVGLLVDKLILSPLSGKYFLYSILDRALTSSFNQSSTASDSLRGGIAAIPSVSQVAKNVFYNLYNFYKLLPQIINPYLFTLFIIGLFKKENKEFKIASLFILLMTLLVTAASIPFFRYIHPIIPLVYIIAVGTLIQIINLQFTIYSQFTIFNFKISKQTVINLTSIFIILIFAVGQTLGILLLDSRFEKNTHNVGKPPVYVELSQILKENTNPGDVVITNLDTWGSWYGERTTVWFPLEPKQLIDQSTGKIPFDAIYLTSYLMDDQNYYMGKSWRLIFDNPKDPSKWACDRCIEIANEFKLSGEYLIDSGQVYESMPEKGLLFKKIISNSTNSVVLPN